MNHGQLATLKRKQQETEADVVRVYEKLSKKEVPPLPAENGPLLLYFKCRSSGVTVLATTTQMFAWTFSLYVEATAPPSNCLCFRSSCATACKDKLLEEPALNYDFFSAGRDLCLEQVFWSGVLTVVCDFPSTSCYLEWQSRRLYHFNSTGVHYLSRY